jgi:allophanate hydrolase
MAAELKQSSLPRTLKEWRDLALEDTQAWATAMMNLLDRCHEQDQAGRGQVFIQLPTPDQLKKSIEDVLTLPNPQELILYGVPVAVKDNIDAPPLATTAACPEYSFVPDKPAKAVGGLLSAGALIIGKTNMDQFATGLVGLRSPYPPPLNPANSTLIPGGSSSGSAVSVALDLVPLSLGTDTAGSGRVPAAMNGLWGLKPSRGMISNDGVVPACKSLDCVSIFAKEPESAGAALQAMSPESASLPLDPRLPQCIGIPEKDQLNFDGDLEALSLWESAVSDLREKGITVKEMDFAPLFSAAKLLYEDAYVAERWAALGDFISSKPEALHPVTLKVLQTGQGYGADDLFRVLWKLEEAKTYIAAMYMKVDALMSPTIPRPAKVEEVLAQPIAVNSLLGTYTNYMNLLDLCGLALPWGSYSELGIPGSLTLIGPKGHDLQLLSWGKWLKAGKSQNPVDNQGESQGFLDIAVVGAHLTGFPLNYQLTERGARLVSSTATAKEYQMVLLDDGPVPKPGLLPAGSEGVEGKSFPIEVWRMPLAHVGSFLSLIPMPLGLGKIKTIEGGLVTGFICQGGSYRDISSYGGWAAYIESVI